MTRSPANIWPDRKRRSATSICCWRAGASGRALNCPNQDCGVPSSGTATSPPPGGKSRRRPARFQAHPSHAVLLEDARHFFKHIGFFTRHGQSGMRKLLLTGPPGTGKTSILMALAAELARELPVVLAGEDEDVVFTCAKAAAQKRPCVVMVEEMDMLVRPSSAALGFLDGTDTPRNPAGTYLIATTNYPRKIDKRILKRPGRIGTAARRCQPAARRTRQGARPHHACGNPRNHRDRDPAVHPCAGAGFRAPARYRHDQAGARQLEAHDQNSRATRRRHARRAGRVA